MPRLPLLALLAVLAGSFAFHAYRAEHPTSSYQSADERAYGRLAVGIADKQTYGNGLKDALHWPPGGPTLFAAGHAVVPGRGERRGRSTSPSAYWLQAIVSLGTALAAFTIAALLAGAWAGVAAAALVGFYPPLILATGEQLTEPFGAFWVTTAFALFAVAARLGQGVGVRARRAGARRRGADARGPAAGAVRARAARGGVDVAGGARPQARAAGRRLHPRRRGAGDRAVERLRVQRAGEFVPVTRGSSSALFVGTYLPGNGTTVGMKRSLGAAAKRRNPKLRGRADFDLEARSVLAVVADRHPDLEFNRAVALEARKNISRYVQEDPVGYAKMMLNKVQRMWSRYARGGARHTTWTIRGPHIALVLLALAGLLAGVLRRRSLLLACILAAALTSTAVHMLVVSQARYNLPLMPSLLAGGLAGWVMFVRGPRRDALRGGPRGPAGRRIFVEESGQKACLPERRADSVARCDGSLLLPARSPAWPCPPRQTRRSPPTSDAQALANSMTTAGAQSALGTAAFIEIPPTARRTASRRRCWSGSPTTAPTTRSSPTATPQLADDANTAVATARTTRPRRPRRPERRGDVGQRLRQLGAPHRLHDARGRELPLLRLPLLLRGVPRERRRFVNDGFIAELDTSTWWTEAGTGSSPRPTTSPSTTRTRSSASTRPARRRRRPPGPPTTARRRS